MKIRIYLNNEPGAPRWQRKTLPIRQTLLWLWPLFVLIQRGPQTQVLPPVQKPEAESDIEHARRLA